MADSAAAAEAGGEPVKRGRGRPRKPKTVVDDSEPKEKRPRGRPKGSGIKSPKKPTAPPKATEGVKKGRGRPKKRPVQEEVEEEEEEEAAAEDDE